MKRSFSIHRSNSGCFTYFILYETTLSTSILPLCKRFKSEIKFRLIPVAVYRKTKGMFLVKVLKQNSARQCVSQQHVRALSLSVRTMGIFNRSSTSESKPEDSAVEILDNQDNEVDAELEQRRINFIRNKSGLHRQHRNILHGNVPYSEGPESWVHQTLKYQRKIYGQYGSKANIDPSKQDSLLQQTQLTLFCRNLLLD